MQQIINFIIRNKIFLLFLLLVSISFFFTIQSHSYHKSKFINSANFLTGGIYSVTNSVSQYFDLKYQNKILLEENKHLKSHLYNIKTSNNFLDNKRPLDSIYKLSPAQVIKNSYSSNNNYLLINIGEKQGVKQDFGVITSKGILGIIDQTSSHYSTVISILNTKSRISAKLKKSHHFGSLIWNTKKPNIVQLIDVPKSAKVAKGDTILTSGISSIFPKNIPIGLVTNFKLDAAENFYEINIKLFNDMTNIEHAYVIENTNFKEIDSLLNTIPND